MPRVTNIETLYKNQQHTLFIRTRTRVEDLPALIGRCYGALAAHLGQLGEVLNDIPYVGYHNMDMADLDVEIGFPVARALPGGGEIQAGLIPAGRQAFCIFRGSYAETESTYGEMAEWFSRQGFTPPDTVYEFYYNGPEFPESEFLTRIVMPIP